MLKVSYKAVNIIYLNKRTESAKEMQMIILKLIINFAYYREVTRWEALPDTVLEEEGTFILYLFRTKKI